MIDALARRRRPGSSSDPRARGSVLVTGATAVAALLVGYAAFWMAVQGGYERVYRWVHGPVPTAVAVSLTPDSSGTRVELIQESPTGELPETVDVRLPLRDAATGEALRYSDVRDSFDEPLPAAQAREAHFPAVRTDGRQVRLTFHLDPVGGRRMVHVLPQTDGTGVRQLKYYRPTGTVDCLEVNAAGAPAGPCRSGDGNTVDITTQTDVVLELKLS